MNMKLINADELNELMYHEASAMDSETVKHGHWINDRGLYKCSCCNMDWTHWWAVVVPIDRMNEMMKFCPECGAKMDEVEE